MVIEHTFITTMEADEALWAIANFLAARGGFATVPDTGFAPITAADAVPAPRAVELSRGVTNPARAKGIADLPQRVRVEWDRGRVSVAASITPKNEKTTRRAPYLLGPEAADLINLPAVNVMGCLLLTVTRVAESLISHRDPHQAATVWGLLEMGLARRNEVREQRARQTRNRVLVVVCVLIALLVGLAVWASTNSTR
jgi:hypothetical protein